MRRYVVMIGMLMSFTSLYSQNSPQSSLVASFEMASYKHFSSPPAVGFTFASNNFQVYYYCMHWNINPAVRYISGFVTNYFTMTATGNQLVYDLDENLIVDSIRFRKASVVFSQAVNNTVTVNLGVTLNTADKDSLTIYYHGTPPDNSNGYFIQTTHNGVPVLWTLSEPYGARDWWPCRNGLDDKADSIDIYITHPAAFSASANGVLISTTSDGNNIISHYRHRYPIATYLVGIAVTNYVQFSKQLTLQAGTLPVTTAVYPESLNYFQNNIQPLYNALQLYDQYFGAYPFIKERYGQTQFSWTGGMEHQTNSFIVNADENLMAHELAHQWFGDKITCASWQDAWLNEGFATWMADMFYNEHFHPDNLAQVVSQDLSNILSKPHGSVWVDDTASVDRIFDDNLTYKKGAFLVRMLRRMLGDTVFFEGLHQYQNDTALQYHFARTADLQRNLEKVSGKNLDFFFNQWLYGRGYPSVQITWLYNSGNVQAIINETTSDSSVPFFKMPLDLLFKSNTQAQMITIDLSKNNQRFTLPVSFTPDTILIDPSQYLITYNNTATRASNLQAAAPLTIALYPNPVKNTLHIQTNSDEVKPLQISIVNTGGVRVVKKTVMLNADASFTLSVSRLSAGMYYLSAGSGNGKFTTQKFIKY